MAKNPDKKWVRCLYCDASIEGDDAKVAGLHDPYCPHGKALLEAERLSKLINTPHTDDFLEAVKLEAAHQRERWGISHDRSKSAENWYWLVGYLAGKALRAAIDGNREKALHHTISSGAALLQWHEAIHSDPTGVGLGADVDLDPDR